MLKQVQLNKCSRKGDRSLVYTFETLQEGTSQELMEGDELVGKRGVIYFANQIDEKQQEAIDLSVKDDIFEQQKTKSQVLRYSILKLAKAKGVDKEEFYKKTMDKFINHVQGQI